VGRSRIAKHGRQLYVVSVSGDDGPELDRIWSRMLASFSFVDAAEPTPSGQASPPQVLPQVYTVGGNVTRPRLLHRVMPDVEKFRAARKSGVPIVEAIIGKDGSVLQVRVVRPVDPSIDAAMIEAVKQWRFEPARLNGKPVNVYFTLTMNIDWQ
jgi:protein TonB